MKISVIGLGKLGACTAACFSAKGYEVIGVDINNHFVKSINEGLAPVYEPRLQDLISLSKGRLTATQDFAKAINETNISFLIVPTPSKEDGHFSDAYLKEALKHLSLALKTKDAFHTFVITSTVSPGTINNQLIPLIEEISGKKLNIGFGMSYNPEFIALGTVITDFLNPDMVLIGESSTEVGNQIEEIYSSVCETKPHYARMSLISAEIAKISVNSYVTMKISFANTLASLCEEIEGTEIDKITQALGADKRIAPHYLKGGLGFGGPCFPRDNRAFSAFAKEFGIDARLAKATDDINHEKNNRLCQHIKIICENRGVERVSIFGLSYKPCTAVIEESPAIKLISSLIKNDIQVTAFDPLAMDAAKAVFGEAISYADSIDDALNDSSVYIFMTTDPLWKTMDAKLFAKESSAIIDCWRIFDSEQFAGKADYICLGKHQIDLYHAVEIDESSEVTAA